MTLAGLVLAFAPVSSAGLGPIMLYCGVLGFAAFAIEDAVNETASPSKSAADDRRRLLNTEGEQLCFTGCRFYPSRLNMSTNSDHS